MTRRKALAILAMTPAAGPFLSIVEPIRPARFLDHFYTISQYTDYISVPSYLDADAVLATCAKLKRDLDIDIDGLLTETFSE